MATRHKVTVSTRPKTQALTGAERRAAQAAALATQQGELKQQAADRREKRATSSAANPPATPRTEAAPAPRS